MQKKPIVKDKTVRVVEQLRKSELAKAVGGGKRDGGGSRGGRGGH